MTEDGWRLVTRVEFEVAQIELRKPSADEAKAAISAVLDDMVGNLEGDFPRMEESTVDLNHYGAVKTWLTAKRKGLGL